MKRIAVIDGQGGGIGSTIIKKLKLLCAEDLEIIALGTNAIATTQMLKAGANRGASGQNAIVQSTQSADLIMGPISIIMAHAMLGEVTPQIAEAIAKSPAQKLFIPLSQEKIRIAGIVAMPLPELVDELIGKHLQPYLEKG